MKLFIYILLYSTLVHAGSWNQKASIPAAVRYGGVGFSIGTKGYLCSGYVLGGGYSQEFWEWDQASDTWTQKANFIGPGRLYGAGFAINTKGYIGGGGSLLNDFYEWDQVTNNWSQKGNIGSWGINKSVGFTIGNYGYFATGQNYSNTIFEYDPLNDSWSQKANLPNGAARYSAAGFSIGTKGYICSGMPDPGAPLLNDLWEWDQTSNMWTQKSSYPGPSRHNAIAFSLYSKGYIGTGVDSLGTHLTDFWEWDQITDSWIQIQNLPAPGRELSVSFTIGNLGYCTSGEYNPMYNDLWEYCPLQSCLTGLMPDISSTTVLQIFPNPSTSSIYITDNGNNPLQIFDLKGEQLEVEIMNVAKNLREIDITHLNPGIYIIKTIGKTEKFLKLPR
jgi:hypothetical protein